MNNEQKLKLIELLTKGLSIDEVVKLTALLLMDRKCRTNLPVDEIVLNNKS